MALFASEHFSNTFAMLVERFFPIPAFLTMPACGVDISDTSYKVILLERAHGGWAVADFESSALPTGLVLDGIVLDPERLGAELAKSRIMRRVGYVHAALSEEAAFVVDMHVPDITNLQAVRTTIEFELEGRVPLKVRDSVFDYDIVAMHPDGVGAELGVSVFANTTVQGFVEAFKKSGATLLSLELEARSAARAMLPRDHHGVAMIIDFGRARTGVSIVKNGIPIFTRTVPVGGSLMTQSIMDEMHVSETEAEEFKNTQGLAQAGDPKITEVLEKTASALSDEIARHHSYWDDQRDASGARVTRIEKVVLTGGNANLKGLTDFIAARLHANVERADVWQNVADYDAFIPPIDREHALGYATSIGLALRSRS